jgi:hypothetical protein
VVFRNGSIFDTFVDDDVEPVGILEGMFGRTRGARPDGLYGADRVRQAEEVSVAGKCGRSGLTRGAAASDTGAMRPLRGADVAHVKIVDFDEEAKETNKGREKIKITYFD